MDGSRGVKATMLLADAVQEAGGKLFVLGGGWSVRRGAGPFQMGLAIKLEIPWTEANVPHQVVAELLTQDGAPAATAGNPIRIEGKVEVGRPPGIPAGTSLDAPMALNFNGVQLEPGGYRWQLTVDGEVVAEASFLVMA
jgi:hypothetical protein